MKIYITGPAGSGKSTLANQLGKQWGVPVIHLDEILWNDDWTENESYPKLQKEAIEKSEWIIEGSSCSIIKLLQKGEKIIILDFPILGNIFRIIKRCFKSKILGETRIGIHIPERCDLNLFWKSIDWRKRQLPRIQENIKNIHGEKQVLILKDPYSSLQESNKYIEDILFEGKQIQK